MTYPQRCLPLSRAFLLVCVLPSCLTIGQATEPPVAAASQVAAQDGEGIVVQIGDVQVIGDRDAPSVAAIINGAWDSTRACVAKTPFAPMTATLVIEANGRVASAAVAPQDPGASVLARCVSEKLGALSFGERPTRATASISLVRTGPRVVGSLDKEIIRRVVEGHASEIRACYEAELKSSPNIVGRVKMKWVIAGDGRVTQAVTESSDLGSPDVEACLAATILTWVFPKPKGGGTVIVSYPFVFKRSG